jgi:hypothetical protein
MIVCAEPEKIRAQIQGDLVEFYPYDWQAARALIETLPGVLELQTYGELLHVFVDSAEIRLPEIKRALNRKGIAYRSARLAPARMEEAFISLIRRLEE